MKGQWFSCRSMGICRRVSFGKYACCTYFKEALVTLFENDESSARPAGSMEVLDVVWFTHNSKSGQYSSAKVHRSVSVNVDGTVAVNGSSIPDLRYEVIEGR